MTLCPLGIVLSGALHTGVAFDNFDRYVETVNGKATLHDTAGIMYQDINVELTEEGEYEEGHDKLQESEGIPSSSEEIVNQSGKRRQRTYDAISFSR